MVVVRSRPPTKSDDGRVAFCTMMEALSVVTCVSSSSSESSRSDSIVASPPLVPNIVISMEL
jgi:hypothetical protein